jgi:hypothetical protein
MRIANRELWFALLAIILITLLYSGVVYRMGAVPAASGLLGHGLGVIGFLLMLSTETLYSLRKRSRTARWGRMANWLQFHIFTGLVGPYLILLHSSWKFNGLAGIVLLLTVVIVVSGFIGRYIYTAVPRTADGAELQAQELGARIRLAEEQIAAWMEENPLAAQAMQQRMAVLHTGPQAGPGMVIGRVFGDLSGWLDRWRFQRSLNGELRGQARLLSDMIQQQRLLHRQMASLAAARKMLAVWHSVHIPIGMALFTAAFIHIAAAIYYATLLH